MYFVYYAGFYLTIFAFMCNLNGPNLYYVSYFSSNAIKHTTIFARKVFFLAGRHRLVLICRTLINLHMGINALYVSKKMCVEMSLILFLDTVYYS
jgi:hypothetical protein